MNQIEATQILTRVKRKTTSTADLQIIKKALLLLAAVENVTRKSDLIDGEIVQKEDLDAIGSAVGLVLITARKAKKMSQEDLERASKVSQSTISKIEKGLRMISVDEAKKIGKVLQVNPQLLISAEK